MDTTLTILGCGFTLPADIGRYGIVGDVMAVNRAVVDYHRPVAHFCSLDIDVIGKPLLLLRQVFDASNRLIVHRQAPEVIAGEASESDGFEGAVMVGEVVYNMASWCCFHKKIRNSAIFGALVGRKLGYTNIRLLGCPGYGAHYYDLQQSNIEYRGLDWASDNLGLFEGVRASAGITREIFGGISD